MKISVVAVGRNDNYGGDFKHRLQQFIWWTFKQLSASKISSEIIFVNYNPVQGTPIEQFISWPTSDKYVSIKVITVPNEIHIQFVEQNAVKNVPVLEYLAKNIGIRRAQGEYVLAMNPDILIAKNIFQGFLKLKKNKYYRANRVDYSKSIDVKSSMALKSQLSTYATQIWFKGDQRQIDGFTASKYFLLWAKQTIRNTWRKNTPNFKRVLNYFSIPVYYHNIEYKFHCNASGDFMIMHKANWEKLNAYHEKAYISLHVDSIMILQAAFMGLKEHVFSEPIYHLQHERRYDAVNKKNKDQDNAYARFKQIVDNMVSSSRPIIYNDNEWGLRDEKLPISEM